MVFNSSSRWFCFEPRRFCPSIYCNSLIKWEYVGMTSLLGFIIYYIVRSTDIVYFLGWLRWLQYVYICYIWQAYCIAIWMSLHHRSTAGSRWTTTQRHIYIYTTSYYIEVDSQLHTRLDTKILVADFFTDNFSQKQSRNQRM